MYVTVLSITALTGIIVMLRRHIRRHKIKEMCCIIPNSPVGKSCLTVTMQSCGPIIDKALKCLSNNDSIAVCKNHRIGSQTIDIISDKVRNSSADTDDTIGKTALYCELLLSDKTQIAQ